MASYGYASYGIAPGPKRWARAAKNAVEHPNTKAAKLYKDRLALADLVAAGTDLPDVPYEHRKRKYTWTGGSSTSELKRLHATCSLRCAVMQLALEHATLDHEKIIKYLSGEPFTTQWSAEVYAEHQPLDLTSISRPITCFVCGNKIQPVKETGNAAVTKIVRVEVLKPCPLEHIERQPFVIINGGSTNMAHVEQAWTVSLTPGEREILSNYVTPDARVAYADAHGVKVTL